MTDRPASRNARTLERAVRQRGFVWMTGLEDTFITEPHPKTGRTLDEYELTGHYDAWRSDLALVKSLGVGAIRYGVPWYRANPAPGRFDFSFLDSTVDYLLELGVEPILDLVHYGVPRWIDQAFSNPAYPEYVTEYAARVGEHVRDRVHAFTPVNEPRITAWYCGRLGFWPPFQRGWSGFVNVLMNVARGIVRTERALREISSDALMLHVDAGDVYIAEHPDLVAEAAHRQAVGFLALDLVSGRVDERHELYGWLLGRGVDEEALGWFRERPVVLEAVGVNVYPLFSRKALERKGTRSRVVMRYGSPDLVEQLSTMYHARYQCPVVISETATAGSVARRMRWLEGSVAAVRRARERGVPVVGYTWWPMLALIDWAYRRGRRAKHEYVKQMGLWDLAPRADGTLERVPTELVSAFENVTKTAGFDRNPIRAVLS